jgi:hypothetical protein
VGFWGFWEKVAQKSNIIGKLGFVLFWVIFASFLVKIHIYFSILNDLMFRSAI